MESCNQKIENKPILTFQSEENEADHLNRNKFNKHCTTPVLLGLLAWYCYGSPSPHFFFCFSLFHFWLDFLSEFRNKNLT